MTKIRISACSDLHVEFDQGLLERAQSAAASGQLSSKALAWWQHLRERHDATPTRLGSLKKGARVLVEAKLKSRKDGETYKLDIIAEDLEVITRPDKAAA
jgi:hypothetical protein